MSPPEVLATVYAVAATGVIGFQIALIAGAPWGPLTQSGQHPGALPLSGRLVALLSIPILAALAGGVLSAAGQWPEWPRWTGWAALFGQGIVTLLNLVTPSRRERWLWGPITAAMLGLCAAVLAFG